MNAIKAIIVDVDGTIADTDHRLHHLYKTPKDWAGWNGELSQDPPKTSIINIVTAMANSGYYVLLVTGRFNKHREQTIEWMIKNEVPFNMLFMREDGDYRSDHVIKSEIYRDHINPLFEVEASAER
jgi:phosphoglycolate phosphatase-like HAD superfamily hydrolase